MHAPLHPIFILTNSASCLDDTELEFLGAPWPEYQAATNKIGLDVLRLPTPEGLAPALTPSLLDKELTTLIQNYTLRGIPVLVHCRGGVGWCLQLTTIVGVHTNLDSTGRAGVISACWILKVMPDSLELSYDGLTTCYCSWDFVGGWAMNRA